MGGLVVAQPVGNFASEPGVEAVIGVGRLGRLAVGEPQLTKEPRGCFALLARHATVGSRSTTTCPTGGSARTASLSRRASL